MVRERGVKRVPLETIKPKKVAANIPDIEILSTNKKTEEKAPPCIAQRGVELCFS